MKRFMVMCTCLSLVMIVVGGIPQASGEIRGYEVVAGYGSTTVGGGKSAKIVYCSKGRVVLGGGVHRTWRGSCPGTPTAILCPPGDPIVLKSHPYKNPQNGQPGWSAEIKGAATSIRQWRATVYAICAIP
jgi:hypothetical protein